MSAIPLFTIAVAAILSAQAKIEKPVEIRLLDTTFGLDSYVQQPGIRLIRSPETWASTWKEHMFAPMGLGDSSFVAIPPPPSVDFSRTMVLAFFDGQTRAQSWKLLGSKPDKKGTLVLNVRRLPVDTGGIEIGGSPFTFMLLTKTDSAIAVETVEGRETLRVAEFGKVQPIKEATEGKGS